MRHRKAPTTHKRQDMPVDLVAYSFDVFIPGFYVQVTSRRNQLGASVQVEVDRLRPMMRLVLSGILSSIPFTKWLPQSS